MALVYMTDKKVDMGPLENYEFDLAFGSDENNFACKIPLENHCCKAGYILYIENSVNGLLYGDEYGGVIDTISPDTKTKSVTYGGRTWHGILEKKVISPDPGQDYLYLSGEANKVIAFLINRMGLSAMFVASTDDSGIEITNYPVRYGTGYTVIRKMLYAFGGKLNTSFKDGMVTLSAVPYIDYSQNEEWDSLQLDFKITKNYRATNHLICLGTGDLKDRHVIHLFTDKNGVIQPYKLVENPVKNADYILDTSKQVLFGEDEIADKYDYGNAQDTTNYVLLSVKPEDWESAYTNYYKYTNGRYEVLKSGTETPVFTSNTYYEKCVDNYADLVSGGIDKLKKSYFCDKIDISLNPSQTYDINDIVGARENVTGIMVRQPITKKIVKIDKYHETIQYEIGER